MRSCSIPFSSSCWNEPGPVPKIQVLRMRRRMKTKAKPILLSAKQFISQYTKISLRYNWRGVFRFRQHGRRSHYCTESPKALQFIPSLTVGQAVCLVPSEHFPIVMMRFREAVEWVSGGRKHKFMTHASAHRFPCAGRHSFQLPTLPPSPCMTGVGQVSEGFLPWIEFLFYWNGIKFTT